MTIKKTGFTLIELMIVLVVLGILVAVGLPRFTSFIEEGRASATNQEMAAIKSACKMYQMHLREMPGKVKDLMVDRGNSVLSGSAWNSSYQNWRGPYMDGDISEICTDSWGQPYEIYYSTGNPAGYVLYSYGPNGGGTGEITIWLRYDGASALPHTNYLTGPKALSGLTVDNAGP